MTVGLLVRRLRAGYTIPSHQFSALTLIERHGPQTTSQLAALESVRPQSMAHTVQQLQDAGYITRTPDPSDGRQTLIGLSDAGRDALVTVRHESTGWLATAIEDSLSADELDSLSDAIAVLNRLVKG